jgi:hypothetical protein
MVTFEKHLALSSGTGIGIGTISTTSTSYGETTDPAYVYFDSSLYPNSTIYFEALMKTSAGTAYAQLYDTAGNPVSGSEVTTTSTSATRVRSSAITLSTGTYTVRIKVNNGANTNTYYSSRIIVVQSGNAIGATESQIVIHNAVGSSSSASYADSGTINFGFFRYTSANWDGTKTIYLDATFKTSAGTATVGLHDSSNNLVSNSEVTTSSASYVRVRSSAIALSDGTDYKVRVKTSSGTMIISDARIVIQQTGSPTKGESYIPLLTTTTAVSGTGGTFQDSLHKANYDSSNWSLATQTWYHESDAYATSTTGTFETYNLSGAARTTNSNIASLNNSTMTRYRSSALTMPTSQEITSRCDSAATTIYVSATYLLVVMTWFNESAGGYYYMSV